MYTGTLIEDLMATVERTEKFVQQKRSIAETDLRRLFEMQSPQIQEASIFAGAA